MKNIFCSKIVNLLSIGVRKSGKSEKNFINQKLKILAYPVNPEKLFYITLNLGRKYFSSNYNFSCHRGEKLAQLKKSYFWKA